ncbi:MAG: hypothetical protein OJF58_003672 [Enhydrobacter sp.]|nr:MAG: hypothetical protein OJF58_003672 [Enhydrobacter sp.]
MSLPPYRGRAIAFREKPVARNGVIGSEAKDLLRHRSKIPHCARDDTAGLPVRERGEGERTLSA